MGASTRSRSKSTPPALTEVRTGRLQSLDALRGFTMFWIIGGDQLVPRLAKAWPTPWLETLALQFDHVAWNGFVFYDLIFPLFLFMVGASLPFSLASRSAAGLSRQELHLKVFKRAAGLMALGLIFNGLLNFKGLDHLRWPGVLQRISLCYLFGALIDLNFSWRGKLAWVAGLLLGYWAIFYMVAVPGVGLGNLTPEGNLAGYLDRLWLNGRFCCYGYGDNEGFLSTIPAITNVVLGSFAGHWLHSNRGQVEKHKGLLRMGAAALALGYAWSFLFPLNKNLWTSSFALVTSGWGFVLLALFYWRIDVKGWKSWSQPFVWVGMNSITIYMLQDIVDFGAIGAYFVGGLAAQLGGFQPLLLSVGSLGVKFGLLYLLYRQKLFLRL